jgi:AraC-like DNA-binding protein
MGYLLRTRLTCAHADLLAAVPHDGVTVTGVAADCGFGHQGRFAAAYRDRYGVAPATTLRA